MKSWHVILRPAEGQPQTFTDRDRFTGEPIERDLIRRREFLANDEDQARTIAESIERRAATTVTEVLDENLQVIDSHEVVDEAAVYVIESITELPE